MSNVSGFLRTGRLSNPPVGDMATGAHDCVHPLTTGAHGSATSAPLTRSNTRSVVKASPRTGPTSEWPAVRPDCAHGQHLVHHHLDAMREPSSAALLRAPKVGFINVEQARNLF